jgi:excisionase family DNA binding protein
MEKQYLGVAEAAETLGVSQGTVRKWIKQGRLAVIGGLRQHRIRKADFDRLFEFKTANRKEVEG